jgi:molecular chaperone HtpG
MAAKQTPVEAHDALDNLVNQFSDPMSFFRELIQNALDAGSPEIEVWFEFQDGPEGQAGIMIVHVDDFGEGMDREIIDSKLTRLFSSSKDGDLTKIGRFGIGFVSVFAIGPDAVCVDTSRGGENWRILFQRDRSFHRIQRDEPEDGTKIQVIKTATPEEYAQFVRRAQEVVTYWCKHATAEIRFEGEPVNQPFGVDCAVRVDYEADGTAVAVGFPAENKPFFGFYNKGLTLHEGHEDLLGGLVFKINSRYLEHTLTRDNVLRDDNFHKAMEIARELADGPLLDQLYDQLSDGVARGATGSEMDFLYATVSSVVKAGRGRSGDLDDRVFFKTVRGGEAKVSDLRRAHRKGWLLVDTKDSPLIEGLETREGAIVLAVGRKSVAYETLCDLVDGKPPRANRQYCLPVGAESDAEVRAVEPLRRGLRRLFDDHGAKLSDVAFAHFAYPGSSIAHQVAITQKEVGEITAVAEAKELGRSFFSRSRVLVVNADHRTVRRLVEVSSTEPEFASYVLAKLFFLRGELSSALDGDLLRQALTHRALRQAADAHGGGMR